MAFDPDAYLNEKGFDPDAYLAQATPVEFKGGKAQIPGPVAGMQAPAPTQREPARGMFREGSLLGKAEAGLRDIRASGERFRPTDSPAPRLAPDSVLGKAQAAIEAVAYTLKQGPLQGLGMLLGGVGGAANMVRQGQFGTPAGADTVAKGIAEGGEVFAQAVDKPSTPLGQEYADAIARAAGELAPMTGAVHELGLAQAGAGAAKTALAVAGRETKTAVGNAGLDAAAGMVKLNPQKLENAAAAIDAGMDVPLHAVGDRGPIVQGAGEALGHLPASGSKVDSNVRAFNRKVIEHINPEESAQTLTPKVMDRALKTAGKTIGENMRAIEVPHVKMAPALNDIRAGLDTATADAKSVVSGYLGQIEAKALEHNGKLPGAALRELDTKLGEQLRSMGGKHPDIENRLADLQDAIRDAAEGQMTPEQAQATQAARQRYAKTMSLVPAYADIRTQGYLDPGKLMDLVGKSPLSKRLMATGNGGAWQDLAAAGELVAPKGAMTRGRVIGGSVGLGAGGVYLGTTGAMSPLGAAAAAGGVLGAANVYNRVGPKVVRRLVERERKRNAPPPEAPPPELTTEPGAGGPGPAPRGGTVLPAPDDGPLGPAGPELTTSPGAGGVEIPRELSPAEQALSARAPVLDELTIGERAPSRIIKSRKGEVERRAMKDVPAVPGRPDMPEQMNVGAPAEVGRTAADNAALVEPNTALAREKQGLSMAPGKEAPPPVGEAKEVGTYDPRLAEIERLRAQTDNPAVRDALAKREAEVKKAMKAEDAARKRDADATALEDAIRKTEDPEIKAVLRAEADKLREKIPTPEVKEGMPDLKPEKVGKIPVGKTKEGDVEPVPAAPRPKLDEPEVTEIAPEVVEGGEPIPRGEAIEVEPVPAGQADEMLPVGEAAEMLPVGEVSEVLPAADVIEGPPPMDRVPMPPAPRPRMIERGRTAEPPAKAVEPIIKRVKGGLLEGSWLEVTMPDGTVKKMQRNNRPLANEVGGWHDITDPTAHYTYLGDTQAEAIARLKERHARKPLVAAATKADTPAAPEVGRSSRKTEMADATQTPKATASEPRGQDTQARAEQPRPDSTATARADGGKAPEAVSKEQRQAAINAETLENRPDAVEVAQPTKGKRVRVETVTLSGPKTVTANLYELPGYKGPQLAVAEYKSSRGQGYKVYLPKSGAFIHDSNGVQPLNEALKQAVLRIDHARQTLGAKAAPSPAEAMTTVKSLLQPAPRKATAPAERKPLIARKNSEILADLNKQIDERLPDAKQADDQAVLRLETEQKAKPDEAMIKRKYPLPSERERARASIQAGIDQRVRNATDDIGYVTVRSGGTSYKVLNTVPRLQELKAKITGSPAFKDRAQPKATAPRGTEDPASAKRQPKTVVQDFVADGDFENAQALAEHYGLDIKAGMDKKQKQAYQDWLDSRDLTGLADAPPVPEPADTVSGLNLRQVNTRDGMRWEVQNPENVGTDKVLGNRLFESREAAEREAPRMIAEHTERTERLAAAAAEEATRKAETEARRAKNAGKTLMQLRADKVLDEGLTRHNGEVKSKRKMVDDILAAGGKPSTFEEDRIKPMSRTAFNRASNAEQRAHEAKIKAGGKVTRYMVGESEVDKVQYDYAQEKLNAGRLD